MTQGECTIRRVRQFEGRHEPFDWRWARENRPVIEAHWDARRRSNPKLFNGTVLLASGSSIAGDIARATFFEADFASFLAFKEMGFPDEGVANAFAMAALRCADGGFLLGVMGRESANGGHIYFPAGTPDLSDLRPDGSVDLGASVLRELAEETGLPPEAYTVADEWIIVRQSGYLAFMRSIEVHEEAEAARARILAFLDREGAPELEEIVILRDPGDIDRIRTPAFVEAYIRDAMARDGQR